MAIGPGSYDPALTQALKESKAHIGILIVGDGEHGPGFSVQADLGALLMLPKVLRSVADQIEADMKDGKL
jgi:hypothetical protein